MFSNKTDVNGCMGDDEIREVRGLQKHLCEGIINLKKGLKLDTIHTHKWVIFRCSAMTGHNLLEGLEWIVQEARDRYFLY